MTPATHGDALSAVPSGIRRIAPENPGLARATVGQTAGALVEGARVLAVVSPHAPTRVRFDGTDVVASVGGQLGEVANAVASPGLLRREWVGPSGLVTESLLAAPNLPLIWMQWHSTGPTARAEIVIELEPTALSAETRVESRRENAVVLAGRQEGRSVVACLVGEGRITFDPGVRPVLKLVPDSLADAGVTLVLATGSEKDVRGALAASTHAAAHAVRASSGAQEDGIQLETGVPDIDDGFQWARARLASAAARIASHPSPDPGNAMALGLGALGVGDGEGARRALAVLTSGTAEHALLAGRLAAVLDDSRAASTCAGPFLATHTAAPSSLHALAARALADGLRYAAPEARIAELRGYAAAFPRDSTFATSHAPARALPMAGTGRRTLPMVGGEAATPKLSDTAWLQGLLAGDPEPVSQLSPGMASELRVATGLFSKDPDTAWSLWRGILSQGVEGGPAGVGTWDPVSDTADVDEGGSTRMTATAALVLALTQGMLGLVPDAPVGRIRIAPRLPTHLRRFAVSGIPVGDARLRLDYRRDGSVFRYTVTPDVAPVPPLLVFEPSLAGRITSIRVDGEIADLELRPDHSRTIVPVQLAVDGARVLEVEVAG